MQTYRQDYFYFLSYQIKMISDIKDRVLTKWNDSLE